MAHAYFEIVFDDSTSMNDPLAGSSRLEVAKQLFEKEIFPLIDNNTEVAVRLLRNYCGGESEYHKFGTKKLDCLEFIKGIYATKGTPLFNTMKDALDTTLSSGAVEKTIFVLTDGEDTCERPIEQVLTIDEQRYFKQINVILAQFAVSGSYAVNQLSHLANTIGAKTISFASGAGASMSSIRTELKTVLHVVGMNKNEPLRHCFEELPGELVYWKDIEAMGIQLHQARVLYDEHFLSWKPEYSMRVNPLQLAELKFLYGIRFKTGIGVEMMRTMLSQLEKPYYYNSNCIYWHFE
ncbi:MAG: von Willebrand factor type domain, partial [Bacteroidota bacterium]